MTPFFFPASQRARWLYLLALPWLLLLSYLLVGQAYWHHAATFAGATLLNGLLLAGTLAAQHWAGSYLSGRLPRFEQTLRRAGIILLVNSALLSIFLAAVAGLYVHFRLFGAAVAYGLLANLYVLSLVTLVLATSLYETFFFLRQWQQQQLNRETLKRENLSGQLQGLKSQINPHFLFNSFNSLSSLITEEPEKAEQFVDEMARVYRYLLQANAPGPAPGDDLTTLALELRFIESYYHLLKTRHGPALHLTISVAREYWQRRLPPLTLHLLVENALKHNVLLPGRPLHIDIATTAQGHLRVRNNRQQKAAGPGGSGPAPLGLANVVARYRLLAQGAPLIETNPDYFTITLPLLAQVLPTP